ncbi:hypothetical protein HPB49_001534 [Dermacentor silvarum]|uniref:Uncharacterized protein n=1 Tax=Dermacentor silvarum TaxID=543639 RepID=A0ACB8CUD1_DERSI|nr:hypothetical protein HPB49_001534 [Dermacentor silvarum]
MGRATHFRVLAQNLQSALASRRRSHRNRMAVFRCGGLDAGGTKFYRALVHEVSANGNTCVVKFVDYGNHEEVLCSDVQTVSLAQWSFGTAVLQSGGDHDARNDRGHCRQYTQHSASVLLSKGRSRALGQSTCREPDQWPRCASRFRSSQRAVPDVYGVAVNSRFCTSSSRHR